MKHSGYSGTPLYKKLGIKEGYKVGLLNAPKDYLTYLQPIPEAVTFHHELSGTFDLIHAFFYNLQSLEEAYPKLYKCLKKNGSLWIAWPKKASKLQTDLNREILREYVLAHGLVDVKVASYNNIFSGLKFVYRLKDR